MLNRTSELAIRLMLFLALKGNGKPLSPKIIAESLGCSASYLAKTAGLLVRAGLLRSLRGTNGGVFLSRSPHRITLLEIVEACQGLMPSGFCDGEVAGHEVCAFHRAMLQLHERTLEILSSWTLARILECPVSPADSPERQRCRMFFSGCDHLLARLAAGGEGVGPADKGWES